MPVHLDPHLRKQDTLLEVERLNSELLNWLQLRRAADVQNMHSTQLDRIELRLTGALAILRDEIEKLEAAPADQYPGSLYNECRIFDRRIFWVRWIWNFYKEKFDQRLDKQVEKALLAADEVLWSCYDPVVKLARRRHPSQVKDVAPPLAFIEARYSPAAFSSATAPSDLIKEKSEIDFTFQRAILDSIPVSLLRLPPSCITTPWWLVFVAHEVGHHIQSDLQLIMPFREKVKQAVLDLTGDEQQATQWGAWSAEIFADVFSVLMMGQSAVSAMAELELTLPDDMFKRRDSYPAPLVRLRLLAETADQLIKIDDKASQVGSNSLPLLPSAPDDDSAESVRLRSDLKVVPAVVAASLGPLLGEKDTLAFLCSFDPADFRGRGEVESWVELLKSDPGANVQRGDKTPRMLTAAARLRWHQIVATAQDDAERTTKRADLSRWAFDAIRSAGVVGTRAEASVADEDKGVQLARLLLSAPPDQLEG